MATGTVAVQGLWSNSAKRGRGGCVQSASAAASPPAITSVSPGSGPRGSSVTLTGTGLGGALKVAFNGKRAVVTSDTAAQIVATVPPHATSGPITVRTAAGTGTSASSFSVT